MTGLDAVGPGRPGPLGTSRGAPLAPRPASGTRRRSGPWRRIAQVTGAVAGVSVGAVTLVVAVTHTPEDGRAFAAASAVMLGCWIVASAVAFLRRDPEPVDALVVVATVAGVVGFAVRAVHGGAVGDPAPGWVGRSGAAADLVGSAVLFQLVLGLPTGRLDSVGRRVVAAAGWVAALGLIIVSPVAPSDGRAIPTWALPVASVVVGTALGGWAVYARSVTGDRTVRRRVQWVGAVAAGVVAVGLAVGTGHVLTGWPGDVSAWLVALTGAVPLGLATDRTAFVGRHAERVAVGAFRLLVAACGVALLLVVFVVGLAHRPSGDERGVVVATVAALAVATACWSTLSPWSRDLARRLVRSEKGTVAEAVGVVTSRSARRIPLEELVREVVVTLHRVLGDRSVELWQVVAGPAQASTPAGPDCGDDAWGDRRDDPRGERLDDRRDDPRGERLDDRREDCRLVCLAAEPRTAHADVALPATSRGALLGRGSAGADAVRVWLPDLLDTDDDAFVRIVPLVHAAELLGLLVVRRTAAAGDFTDDDWSALTDVARPFGLVLHNARLDAALADTLTELRSRAAELRASRARVVAAADAERRRIERDLHDGAQQQLVALAVSLGVLRGVAATSPDEAVALIDELRGEVQQTIDGLRSLAHGIYPPLLASRGLGEALTAATARVGSGSGTVDVQANGVGRHAPETEAAVYFCCLEAVQNAAKHAPGAAVRVRLEEADGVLRFRVVDDGPGFDPASASVSASAGQGRVNMADRIGAAGGTVTWHSRPGGGCRVEGAVPVEVGAHRTDGR